MITEERRNEFGELFEEFAESYATTSVGQRQMKLCGLSRERAQHNFEVIREAQKAGEDVTEAVTLKLLGHANTEVNYRKGAWIHPAGEILGEYRGLLEHSALVGPHEWPEFAEAVLDLVEACVNDPDSVQDSWDSLEARDVNMPILPGHLSPVLSALCPDSCVVSNEKSRMVLNYFGGHEFSFDSGYSEVNSAAQELVRGVASQLRHENLSDVRLTDSIYLFSHWLVAVKSYFDEKDGVVRYWKIAPGSGARRWFVDYWSGHITVGWGEFGDVTRFDENEFAAKREEMHSKYGDGWKTETTSQLWRFAHEVKPGDRIVANRGRTHVAGFGTVTDGYEYLEEAGNYAHVVRVRWEDATERQVDEFPWMRWMIELDEVKFHEVSTAPPVVPIDAHTATRPPELEVKRRAWPPIVDDKDVGAVAQETGLSNEFIEQCVRAIERKKQAIFYGPPGTGKTYLAKHLARHLTGNGDGFDEIVQFHPAYAYEDFMEGLRPQKTEEGMLRYDMIRGRFREFCEKATNCNGRCVMIIDEINRANLSQVLGELMYLLEYRDEEVPLASGTTFRIPGNVRIIGTMNTADRSIALVDHALRRRFAFIRLDPNFEILHQYHEDAEIDVDGLIAVLQSVNDEIDDRDYHVGITYFLRDDLNEHIEDIWRMEIEPYLEEYFFERPEVVNSFRWENVRDRVGL